MTHFRHHATEVSDFHGLKHICGKGGFFRKLLWLVFFLCALFGFVFQTTKLLLYYFDYHHITMVDVLFDPDLEFPAVTICNSNKYRESALTEDDLKNVGIHLGIIDANHTLIYPDLYTEEFQETLAAVNWTEVEEDENYNMTEYLLRTGHLFEEMVIECEWKGEPCTADNFTLVLTHMGNCYTFNTHDADVERHVSDAAGPSNGLKLLLDIQEEEYIPSNDLDGGAADAGIRFMIHDPTEPPYIKEYGISASPGQHVFVSMKHEKITALPDPYTVCEDDGETTYFDHFTGSGCRIECETDLILEACGCKLPEQPGDADVCGPAVTHECAHPELVRIIKGTSSFGSCTCNNPCEAEYFPTTLSSVKLRAAFLEKIFQQSEEFAHNASYIESNIVELSIYYEALNYETIEMIPEYTIFALMAAVGGNMGLFIGAGLLTMVQLGEYFLDEILTCCGFKRDNEFEETPGCCGCVKKSRIGKSPIEKIRPSMDAWATSGEHPAGSS